MVQLLPVIRVGCPEEDGSIIIFSATPALKEHGDCLKFSSGLYTKALDFSVENSVLSSPVMFILFDIQKSLSINLQEDDSLSQHATVLDADS